MTDPMELVGRLEEWAKEIALDGTPSQIGPSPSELTEAAACIRELVEFVPPISLDGPNLPDEHRIWLARQLLDSKLTDSEAYSIVRHHPGIKDTTHDR